MIYLLLGEGFEEVEAVATCDVLRRARLPVELVGIGGKLIPGASIGLHTHETDCEIIYILSGKGKVLYGGEYEIVSTGDCHYCPNGHSHSLINDSENDLIFFAIVPTK